MEDDKLGIKPEALLGMHMAIEEKARQLAPQDIRGEIAVSQDAKLRTKFYIAVSSRMAPYLIAAVQQQIDAYGMGLKSYFYKLQEQIMAQMFADVKDVID